MKLGRVLKCSLAAWACSAVFAAHASMVWDDRVVDFADDVLAPTPLSFAAGSNTIRGATGDDGTGVDRDYFSFTLPADASLTSLVLLDGTFVSGSVSFIAIQVGPQITASPSGEGAQALLGFTHYGPDLVGIDLLPLLAPSFPSGLQTGTYSIWIQETGGPVQYGLDFGVTQVSSVPLPAAAVLLLSGLMGLGGFRGLRGNAA